MKSMKRCLFVSAHFPSYKAQYAGHKTAFKILKDNSEKFKKIELIVNCNKDEIDLNSLSELKNVTVKLLIPLTRKKKLINILKSRKIFPLKVMSRFSKKILNYVKKNINNYNMLHFEFTHAAFPLIFLSKEIFQGKEIIISCHDILLQSNLRKNFSFLNSIDTLITYRYESKIFSMANKILVPSDKDRDLLISLYNVPKERIKLIVPYISDFVYKVKKLRKKENQENALLFWGAMNREENIEAVIKFVKRYKALLKEKGYKLYIVGANPTKEVLRLASEYDNIVVTGFVEDPTEYFVKAKIGIVPLLKGAGVKVKTLEMLEAGLKVISTPIGAEGIEHENLVKIDFNEFGCWL